MKRGPEAIENSGVAPTWPGSDSVPSNGASAARHEPDVDAAVADGVDRGLRQATPESWCSCTAGASIRYSR